MKWKVPGERLRWIKSVIWVNKPGAKHPHELEVFCDIFSMN